MKLADVSKFQTHLNIDETDIAKIRLGQAVDITLDAYPDAAITGKISEIAPGATVLQGVVNYVVTVAIDPAQVEVKPGMTANADVQVVRKENALLIPSRAIRAANQQHFVTIRSGQATREVEVKIGLSNDQETEIVSGLNEGDEVLLTVVPTNRPPGFGGQ
jgi:multidrug efflux pump subunit AcrA (membrane-fusion protein)